MKRIGFAVVFLLVAGLVTLATPAQAAPCGDGSNEVALEDSAGWTWDLEEDGAVEEGIGDAFDTYPEVTVGGVAYPDAPANGCTHEEGGREVAYPEATLAGLEVSRKVFVPANGTPFARFLTLLRNAGGAPVTTTYRLEGNLGSDSDTEVRLTSSGDTTVAVGDAWAVSDDSGEIPPERDDPTLLHVWDGSTPGAPQALSAVSWSSSGDDGPQFDWSVTVPPGSTFVFMHVVGQRSGFSIAAADAPILAAGAPDVFVGMSADERAALRNWVVPTCQGKTATIFGTASGETLGGTEAADVILAGDGDDQITALGGNDTVCAGGGDDRANGGGGKDLLAGEDGDDNLKGAGGNDRLLGAQGSDAMNGGPGKKDTCKGGPGADTAKACEKGKA
jgi:RTX calcium-binding nonapeptide repeat (4 copies)